MRSMKPDRDVCVKKIRIRSEDGEIPVLVLSPKRKGKEAAPGILWIHGGGYILGMKEMVHMSRAVDLVKKYGAVVISPGYRMAFQAPYPAAVKDCYAALLYLKAQAEERGVRSDQIMVGGESAGGGLCVAVCMMARDFGTVNIAFQMPLYPMLDDRDTESSRDNHGKIWNTAKNHFAWKKYLQNTDKSSVPVYAAPARATDYSSLPPAYTFVGDGEPFYAETLRYIRELKKQGIPARVDVYHSDMHAFDMMRPEAEESRAAAAQFNRAFAYAKRHFFAEQMKKRS